MFCNAMERGTGTSARCRHLLFSSECCDALRLESDPACVCVCVTMKKGVPDEWQARQATQTILQVSSSKHNAKKITTRVRGPFHQSITAILTEEKREEKQFTKPTHVAVYLFRDLDRDRSRL